MKKYLLLQNECIWIKDNSDSIEYRFENSKNISDVIEEVEPGIFAAESECAPFEGARLVNLRQLFDICGPESFHLAGRAHQLLHWRKTHRFCGCCGSPLKRDEKEIAMRCEPCSLLFYPRINPVIITLIYKGESILLAQRCDPNYNHFWSVVAGFVEAGESLENAVRREIAEEVGLKVKNIRCIGSQQWPFPNNLMIGFYAEYDSGEIRPDGEEIAEAKWFTKETLPRIPSKVSIARHLIDSFFSRSQLYSN